MANLLINEANFYKNSLEVIFPDFLANNNYSFIHYKLTVL